MEEILPPEERGQTCLPAPLAPAPCMQELFASTAPSARAIYTRSHSLSVALIYL